jgi:hypothetical protein
VRQGRRVEIQSGSNGGPRWSPPEHRGGSNGGDDSEGSAGGGAPASKRPLQIPQDKEARLSLRRNVLTVAGEAELAKTESNVPGW